ncbi:hypothetical protein TL16_g05004 [Triparma laevis f. inornata]|uniref:Methyltransferase domain-containing protein n=1 Tax=Triparma laevis f. inornata TaxID=1714386 RepID=A0A9W7AF24_9STRA|nr:hypothetical protein TL16_g05004 [Triparma laevis f. inornata]
MDQSSTVLSELDNLLPVKSGASGPEVNGGRSPLTVDDSRSSPTVQALMFGDLSEAFENLDTRDVNSPSRPRFSRSTKKTSLSTHNSTPSNPSSPFTPNETFSTPNLLSPSPPRVRVPNPCPPRENLTHSIQDLALSNSVAFKNLSTKSETYKKKITTLQSHLTQKTVKVDTLKDKYRNQQATNDLMTNQVKRLDSTIDNLTKEITDSKLEKQRLRSKELEKDVTIKNLQSRVNDLKSHIQEQSYVQEGEGRRVKAAMDGLNVVVSNLRSKLSEYEGVNVEASKLKEENLECKGRLKEAHEELKRIKDDNDYLTAQRKEWEETLETNKTLKDNLRRLKSSNDELTGRCNRLQGAENKLKEAEGKLEEVKKQFKEKEESLKSIKLKHSKCVPQSKVKILEEKLKEVTVEYEKTSSSAAQLESERTKSMDDLEALKECQRKFIDCVSKSVTHLRIGKDSDALVPRSSGVDSTTLAEENYENSDVYNSKRNKIFKECHVNYLKPLLDQVEDKNGVMSKIRETVKEHEKNEKVKSDRIRKLEEELNSKNSKIVKAGGSIEKMKKELDDKNLKESSEKAWTTNVKKEIVKVSKLCSGLSRVRDGDGRSAVYSIDSRLKGLKEIVGREEGGEDWRDVCEAFVGIGEEFRGVWEEGRRKAEEVTKLDKEVEELREKLKGVEGEAETRHKLLSDRERETSEKDRNVREAVGSFHEFIENVQGRVEEMNRNVGEVGDRMGVGGKNQLLLRSRSRTSSSFVSYGNRSKDDTGVSEVQTLCREVGRDVDERFRGVEGVLDEIKRKVEFEESSKNSIEEEVSQMKSNLDEERKAWKDKSDKLLEERDELLREIERLKTECIVSVTEAEQKYNKEASDRVNILSKEVDSANAVNRGLRDEVSSLRRSLKEYRERLSGVEESTRDNREGVGKVGRALRLVVRGVVPMSRRLAELRSEKKILWNLVKESWVWENELLQLAGAIVEGGGKRRIRLRSIVVMVLACNRFKSDRAPDSVRNVRSGMGKMARRINEMEEERLNLNRIRGVQSKELIRFKEYTTKLVGAINEERKKNKDLDERSQALAAECLESVPESKMQALNDELLHQKRLHVEMSKRYADLQGQFAEKEMGLRTNEEVLERVKEELDRTNSQLDSEREEVGRCLHVFIVVLIDIIVIVVFVVLPLHSRNVALFSLSLSNTLTVDPMFFEFESDYILHFQFDPACIAPIVRGNYKNIFPPSKFNTSAADFDAALARFSKLDTSTSAKTPTYLLSPPKDSDDSVIDNYRFPKPLDPTFITPLPVSLKTNLFSISWLVVLNRIFDKLNLTTQDTLVQLSCGDGRWLIEAALKKKCQCIGYDIEPDLQYRCDATSHEQDVTNYVDFRLIDDVLEADLSEGTAIIVDATQEKITELREKLENEVDPFTPIVVVGGEIVGWLSQWETRHRGIPIYLYNRRTDSVLGSQDVHKFREVEVYRNPNDRLMQFSEDFDDGGGSQFHAEDLGSRTRGEDEGNLKSKYVPEYKPYIHTPHGNNKRK